LQDSRLCTRPSPSSAIDFGEQFPYDPEEVKTVLEEAAFDQKNPLCYAIMTHGTGASLPSLVSSMKTPDAKLGVEVTVDVIEEPIVLRRLRRDPDWERTAHLTGAALDSYAIDRAIDTRAGDATINHDDTQVDMLIDRMREAGTEEAVLQTARVSVNGYEHVHGFKIRC